MAESTVAILFFLMGVGVITVQGAYKTLFVSSLAALVYYAIAYLRFGFKFPIYPVAMMFVGMVFYLNSRNQKILKIAGITEVIASLAFLILP
ncbi:hypothetical protein GQS78_08125 [Thermococcus bergensis]|uniref:hypothetical protein n=1 Tax=Thermococcus bergensis TaxID=2689387 RepID=UPI001CEDFF57|nr:hypothetical protein [Thermococcus bergensis]MCA6214212.1 hypothetical protein [Thermococcus bergensis]